jgi:hypothetical protein
LLAPLLDVAALSAVCERFVREPLERRRLAQNARRAAGALPSWADAGRQFVANVRAARVHSARVRA